MKSEALPPVHRFSVRKNGPTGPDIDASAPQEIPLNPGRQSQDTSLLGGTRPSSRALTPTLRPGDSDSDSTVPLDSHKSQRLSMSDIINVSPGKCGAGDGVLSSPLTKMGRAAASNSSGAANYTYDFTTTTPNDKHQSSPDETTVGPFDMELRPQVPRKFDGGSSVFNSSFLKKNKPFPITQFVSSSMAPPRSDDYQNMPNNQLILSDDFILSRFDTSFPEPKPIQELFAFDENFPSSTPSAPPALPSAPSTAGNTTASLHTLNPPPPMTPLTAVIKATQAPKIVSKSNAKTLAKKPVLSKITKPKSKYAGKRPWGAKGPYNPPASVNSASKVKSSSSPPPTLPPPTPLHNGSARKVHLPPISDLLKSDVSDKAGRGKQNDISIKKGKEVDLYDDKNIHTMCLRNRKPTDYTRHISLSQLSGTSSPTSTQSSELSVYDPTLPRGKKGTSSFPSSPLKYYSAHKKPPVKRTRVFLSGRSKNGCWTCRIRKKKCTEEKPHCFQCDKLGLKCDGYAEERPVFMDTASSQRKRLDEIKAQTSKNKKVGIKKSAMRG